MYLARLDDLYALVRRTNGPPQVFNPFQAGKKGE